MNTSGPRKRILFVDDEASIRLTLPPILEQAGFEIQVVETISDAMFEINSNSFDVLISDLNIGEEGDGFLVTTAMRHVQPSCVTFILTGYPAFETALQAIHHNVDDYLVKPVDVEAMVRVIRDKLAQRQTGSTKNKRLSSLLNENAPALIQEKAGRRSQATEPEQGVGQFLTALVDALDNQSRALDSEILRRAAEFGRKRKQQDYSPTMLAEEFRSFQEGVYAVIQDNLQTMDIAFMVRDLRGFQSGLWQLLAASMEELWNRKKDKTRSA